MGFMDPGLSSHPPNVCVQYHNWLSMLLPRGRNSINEDLGKDCRVGLCRIQHCRDCLERAHAGNVEPNCLKLERQDVLSLGWNMPAELYIVLL
jgi:hypothetical protein